MVRHVSGDAMVAWQSRQAAHRQRPASTDHQVPRTGGAVALNQDSVSLSTSAHCFSTRTGPLHTRPTGVDTCMCLEDAPAHVQSPFVGAFSACALLFRQAVQSIDARPTFLFRPPPCSCRCPAPPCLQHCAHLSMARRRAGGGGVVGRIGAAFRARRRRSPPRANFFAPKIFGKTAIEWPANSEHVRTASTLHCTGGLSQEMRLYGGARGSLVCRVPRIGP